MAGGRSSLVLAGILGTKYVKIKRGTSKYSIPLLSLWICECWNWDNCWQCCSKEKPTPKHSCSNRQSKGGGGVPGDLLEKYDTCKLLLCLFLHCWWAKNACRITWTWLCLVLGAGSRVVAKCIIPELQCYSVEAALNKWKDEKLFPLLFGLVPHWNIEVRKEKNEKGKKKSRQKIL